MAPRDSAGMLFAAEDDIVDGLEAGTHGDQTCGDYANIHLDNRGGIRCDVYPFYGLA
jgi:hypothetical protein